MSESQPSTTTEQHESGPVKEALGQAARAATGAVLNEAGQLLHEAAASLRQEPKPPLPPNPV